MGTLGRGHVIGRLGLIAALGAGTLTLLLVGSATAAHTVAAGDGNSAGNGNTHCIAPDTKDLTPTSQAPDWYVPGVTKPCNPTASDGGIVPMTAYWVLYQTWPNYMWRTTPDNADYSANDCVASYTTCGTKIIGDAWEFYDTCHNQLGLSASQLATNIHYWADRARANGTNWRVYTYAQSGDMYYTCAFSITHI